MKSSLNLLLTLFLISLLPNNSIAMWAGMSDAELIEQSDLIVKATYIGSSTVILNKEKLHLGVLNIEDTLKGDKQDVVFIRLSLRPKNFPQRSDEINFKAGQKGLWFIEKDAQRDGVYEIKHPQRFLPEQQFKSRLPALFKLLD